MSREDSFKHNAICEKCGAGFYARPNRVRVGGGRFCSWNCANSRTKGVRRVEKVECTCAGCGKIFLEYKSNLKLGRKTYCSLLCYRDGWIGRKFECTCVNCGKKFIKYYSDVKRAYAHFCSWGCYREPKKYRVRKANPRVIRRGPTGGAKGP